MKNIFRVIVLFSVFVMLVSTRDSYANFSTSEYTENTIATTYHNTMSANVFYPKQGEFGASSVTASGEFAKSSNTSSASKAIKNAISKMHAEIDISKHKITVAQLGNIYNKIILQSPMLFYNKSLSYSQKGKYVTKVMPNYVAGKTAVANMKNELRTEIKKITGMVKKSMPKMEKALFVQDYFCANYEYDNSKGKFTAYDIMVTKEGVCQAYSLAYVLVMKEFGIPAGVVSSTKMNHAWNSVRLGGQSYHIDITWNDPVPDQIGKTLHTYFLKSDNNFQKVQKHKHYSYESPHKPATSKKYDNYFWNNVKSKMNYVNKSWYYIDASKRIISYNFKTKKSTTVKSLSSYWKGISNSKVFIGLEHYNGRLYFNTPDKIMSIKPNGTGLKTEKTVSVSGNKRVYGLALQDGAFVYSVGSSPDRSANKLYDYYPSNYAEVKSFKLLKTATVFQHGTKKLKPTQILPKNATVSKVPVWSVSSINNATVSRDGVVSGKKLGKLKVYCNIWGIEEKCTITVKKNPVKKMTLKSKAITVKKKKRKTLKVTVTASSKYKGVNFSSSNKKIATVDKKGRIAGIKAGKATITVRSKYNKKVTATCTVTVK